MPSSKVFNPDIAVIGDFLGAIGENDSEFAPPSLEMHEAEVSLQAIVDPYARADFFLVFAPDEVGVEEGFITFTSLPAGLLLKAGKMRAPSARSTDAHAHLPWTDRPLVTQRPGRRRRGDCRCRSLAFAAVPQPGSFSSR